MFPRRFSEASNAARTFVFLTTSLLKAKKLQPSPLSLQYVLRWREVTFSRWEVTFSRWEVTFARRTAVS